MKTESDDMAEQIKKALVELDAEVGDRIPTAFDWRGKEDTPCDWEAVQEHYFPPVWDAALYEAGVITREEAEEHGHYDTTDALFDITSTVQDHIMRHEGAPRKPTLYEVVDYSHTPASIFAAKFGSWSNALDAAYRECDNPECRRIPEEELLRELRRLTGELGHAPTQIDYEEYGMYSLTPIRNSFGGIRNAREAAGVGHPNEVGVTKGELLAELKRVAEELGTDSPKTEEVTNNGEYAHPTYLQYWESWDDVLTDAGLTPTGGNRIGRENLVAELRRLTNEKGGEVKVKDIRNDGRYSYTAYLNEFGGIEEARQAIAKVA